MYIETTNSPTIASLEHGFSFEADFKFTYAIVLPTKNLVALFIDGWSGNLSFVGKVYDFNGHLVAKIPFPTNGVDGRKNIFWYAYETEEGIWVGFHQIFHRRYERDFGGVYSLNRKKFISLNEAK